MTMLESFVNVVDVYGMKWMLGLLVILVVVGQECFCESGTMIDGGGNDENDGNGFGMRTTALPILDRWFPDQSLDLYWERRPLLSTMYPDRKQGQRGSSRKEVIDAVYNSDLSGGHQETLRSMFHIEHVDRVLSSPHVVLQENVKFLKKIVKEDGSEWNGMLPLDPSDPNVGQRMMGAFQHGGFSLIINSLERQWGSVAQIARSLQTELKPNYVSCNLYLTPPDKSDTTTSGFESHWDWMDVFVVQISGQKLWTVANHPIDPLSTVDSRRKPTLQEVSDYASSSSQPHQHHTHNTHHDNPSAFSDFLLRPGDLLYIPRGFMHNASTVGPHYDIHTTPLTQPVNNNVNNRINSHMLDEETLHNYFQQLSQQPSLHLTFGIEHSCHKIYEALFHYALRDFLSSDLSSHTHTHNMPSIGTTSFTFPIDSCALSLQQQQRENHDLPLLWESILHAAISYVARESNHIILRKSVPITKPLTEIANIQQQQQHNNCNHDNDKKNAEQTCHAPDPVLAGFEESLTVFQSFIPNLESTMRFVYKLQTAEHGDEFCLPHNSYQQAHVMALFQCKLEAVQNHFETFLQNDENKQTFQSLWGSFLQFISSKLHRELILKNILTEMQKQNQLQEQRSWNKNKALLQEIGQKIG